MENFINLKKSNVLKIGIRTDEGIDTGNFLTFDLEDIELPMRVNECNEQHRKNINNLQRQFDEIDKIQEKKGKQILSLKEKRKLQAYKDFYQKEMLALDLILGEGGSLKMLNGRNPYFSMFDDFMEALEPIFPLLNKSKEDIVAKIKDRYSNKKDGNIIE